MDIAVRREAEACRLVANATQLNEGTGSRGQEIWSFLDWPHALSGFNVSRIAAFSLGVALAFVFGTSARAADLIGQVSLQAPRSVAAPFDWTGVYFGGHVGYSRGYGRNTPFDPDPTAAGTSFGSLFGGLQFGYNYLLASRLLVGIEGDISFPNFLDDGIVTSRPILTSTVTEKLDFVSTLRGRVGYAFDHWLIYATGGLAWSQARFLEDPGLTSDEDKVLRMRAGWALGAGAELAIAPGWTARLDYLYDHLEKAGGTFPSGTGYESTTVDLHSLRLGLNRKLDWTGATTDPGDVTRAWAIDPSSWNVHGQFTYVGQGYPAFHSPYQGANSLSSASQIQNTASATAFVGFRPWDGTEIYVNPELMQGFGLSNTLGVAGFPNGEAQKSDFPMPRFNVARVFLRQTFGLGGEQETIEDGPNQLGGKQDISRITVTAGKFAVTDIFDVNAFAGDPRTTFLNWNIYGGGSYDWTMDKISYTWGASAELNQKYGRFVPAISLCRSSPMSAISTLTSPSAANTSANWNYDIRFFRSPANYV